MKPRARRAVATALVLAAAIPAAALARGGSPGASGLADPFFPRAGNGGYDVGHYDLRLRWRPPGLLAGRARIAATATQDLTRFGLDLRRRLHVTSVRVDGRRARFTRRGRQELRIRATVASGEAFRVVVAYHGRPRYVVDPDGSRDGWLPTPDGALVAGEPQGAPTWFPCNDHPTDKASFEISVAVPRDREAISNGVLVGHVRHGRRVRYEWRQPEPMATYLATVAIGRFEVERGRALGVPLYTAVGVGADRGAVAKVPAILRFLANRFGPYPFSAAGAIVDRTPVTYSLELQTKPYFPPGPDDILIAHELAHQWFGDSVSLERWPEIWLNEGFATWAQWRWREHGGGETTAQTFTSLYEGHGAGDSAFWNPPPGDPGDPEHLFDATIYERGGMTLEALRQLIGNTAFWSVLRAWAAEHRYGNASIADFVALTKAHSDVPDAQLDQLFQDWLHTAGKPPLP